MKITIKGHPTRGKEVIQILESLGGRNISNHKGNDNYAYYIGSIDRRIYKTSLLFSEYRHYTLEEFEKEFPYKIGDKVIARTNEIVTIVAIVAHQYYKIRYEDGKFSVMVPSSLKPYKEMKEKRNITLTLDKAKEWYKKGGELKEVALQAFTEKELNFLPRSWEEYCNQGNPIASWRYSIPTKYEALYQLEQLRNCWRQGWEPDWSDAKQTKYYICYYQGEFRISTLYETRRLLSFLTYEMAKEFLECFRDLIEKAGDLI